MRESLGKDRVETGHVMTEVPLTMFARSARPPHHAECA